MRIAVAGGTGTVGRYVVEAAQARGHDVVVLSRARGVDVRAGQGLEAALSGVAAIIDVTDAGTTDRQAAASFFTDVASQLQAVGSRCGVGHLVTLSIVGIDRAPDNGYFAAKLRQEQLALAGPVPATVLRATHFHEFAAQSVLRAERAGVAHVPNLRIQPIAARRVAEHLLAAATAATPGRVPDLAGPEQAELVSLARGFVGRFRMATRVVSVESTIPVGANLPGPSALRDGPTFREWLETEDAARLARRHQG
jgi:uncharacterized protein YbjT (DUF2867 family)